MSDQSHLKASEREPVVLTKGKVKNTQLQEQLLSFIAKNFYYMDQENLDVTIGLDNWNICVNNMSKELQALATSIGTQQKVRSLLRLVPIILSMSASLDQTDIRPDMDQAVEEDGLDFIMAIIGKSHFDAIKRMVISPNQLVKEATGPIKKENIEQSVKNLTELLS